MASYLSEALKYGGGAKMPVCSGMTMQGAVLLALSNDYSYVQENASGAFGFLWYVSGLCYCLP